LTLFAVCVAVLPGCVIHHTRSDRDAARYAGAWEMPRLKQQVLDLDLRTERGYAGANLLPRTLNILLGSGKFRLPREGEDPTVRLELTVSLRRELHVGKTLFGALVLYAWPLDVRDYVCEAFVAVRTPDGTLVGRCYAQGRGKERLWLGYLLWPEWLWNDDEAKLIYRDTVKVVTVKACRMLMPEATK
jgi:hypothetical protein